MTLDINKIANLTAAAAVTPPTPPIATPVATPVDTLKTFEVKLEGEPAVVVEDCIDRLDAQEKYMQALGIIKSERKFTYTEIL